MSLPKKLSMLMETKRGEQYPRLPSASSTGTLLVEQDLGIRSGNTVGNNMTSKMLVEATSPVLLTIVEGKSSEGKIYARGEFGRVDVPTANGRIYPRKLMEREINRLKEDIASRSVSMCGCCDHPADGKTSIKEISHVVTDLSIGEDGIVYGEAEVLDKTPAGKVLRGLIESGIKVGVSSRGYGSTSPVRGKLQGEEVQDDFVLKTYDFVSDPAMRTAIPAIYTEDVDEPSLAQMFLERFPEIAKDINLNEEVSDAVKLKKEVEKELSESFERKLKDALIGLKEDVTEQLKEEYSSDPEIGGAKGVLAAIAEMVAVYTQVPTDDSIKDALKASELAVSEAIEEKEKYVQLAKKTAYALNLERKISGHAMAESIRKLFEGREFESLDVMNEAISSVLKDMNSDVVVPAKEAQLMEENAKLKGEVTLLESKVDDLKEKVERAVKLGERVETQRIEAIEEANSEIDRLNSLLEEATLSLAEEKSNAKKIQEDAERSVRDAESKVYKLNKVVGFTNGRKMIELMESVTDSKVVDVLVENLGVKKMQDPMLEDMRTRVLKGKVSRDNMVFEDYSSSDVSALDELGNDMDEMARLVGIPAGKQQLV
jgi:hypothetical protein